MGDERNSMNHEENLFNAVEPTEKVPDNQIIERLGEESDIPNKYLNNSDDMKSIPERLKIPQEIIEIATCNRSISSLSEEQRKLLAEFLQLEPEILLEYAESGLSVRESIFKDKQDIQIDESKMLSLEKQIAEANTLPNVIVAILEANGSYLKLPDNEKKLLLDCLHVRIDTMTECAKAGYFIKESLPKARIMQWLNINLTDTLIMIKNHDADETKASCEAQLFSELQSKFDWPNDSESQKLIELLVSGQRSMNIIRARIASIALNIDINEIIAKPDSLYKESIFDGYNKTEISLIKSVMQAYALDSRFVADYLANHTLSPQELSDLLTGYQDEFYTVNTVSGSSADEWTEITNKGRIYPENPFSFNTGSGDSVNLETGALAYQDTIASIPGRNGLNLDLALTYNSYDATSEIPLAQREDTYLNFYRIKVSATPMTIDDYYTYLYGSFLDLIDLIVRLTNAAMTTGRWWTVSGEVVAANQYDWVLMQRYLPGMAILSEGDIYLIIPGGVFDNKGSYVLEPYGALHHYEVTKNKFINGIKPITYETPFEYMGDGWSFNFSRVITDDDSNEISLRLSNGAVYRYQNGVTPSNLKKYLISDIKFTVESTSSYKNSKYRLDYKNGNIEYFDNKGRIIGRKDRSSNIIDFTYNIGIGYNGSIIITDTNNLTTTIAYTPISVTVTLPDQGTVKYSIENGVKGKVLTQKIDQLNRITAFIYESKTVDFNFFIQINNNPSFFDSPTNNITYNMLKDVVYPSGAISSYTNETAARNTHIDIFNGFTQYCRFASRQDIDDSVVYNRIQYSYSDNNFSGYPNNYDMDSATRSLITE